MPPVGGSWPVEEEEECPVPWAPSQHSGEWSLLAVLDQVELCEGWVRIKSGEFVAAVLSLHSKNFAFFCVIEYDFAHSVAIIFVIDCWIVANGEVGEEAMQWVCKGRNYP